MSPHRHDLYHRWACLLNQQQSITVYHLPTKENKLPFPFCLQQTNGSLPFPIFACSKQREVALFRQFRFRKYICISKQQHIFIYTCCHFKRKTEAQVILLNLFTVCSSCNWKSVICSSVDGETNGRYLLEKGLNRLIGLVFL